MWNNLYFIFGLGVVILLFSIWYMIVVSQIIPKYYKVMRSRVWYEIYLWKKVNKSEYWTMLYIKDSKKMYIIMLILLFSLIMWNIFELNIIDVSYAEEISGSKNWQNYQKWSESNVPKNYDPSVSYEIKNPKELSYEEGLIEYYKTHKIPNYDMWLRVKTLTFFESFKFHSKWWVIGGLVLHTLSEHPLIKPIKILFHLFTMLGSFLLLYWILFI